MKFFGLTALLASVASATPEISSNSVLGQNLLAHARRLEGDNADNTDTWLTGYSVKFQGCHNIKAWNDNADGEDDVRIATTSLVLFRLCPTDSCSPTKAGGCTAGYADYVIETSTFIYTYYEAARQVIEYNCQKYLAASCNCVEGDDQGDDFNKEYCEYNCYNDAKMTQCIDQNPYDEANGEENQKFEPGNYMTCAQLEIPNNNRRQLNDEVKYYVGPYCANQGGAVFLGLFSDDTCTTAVAEGTSFESLMGYQLPYATTSIVDASCLTCIELANAEENNANDQADGDAVSESCETLYSNAGKCEASLPNGTVATPNNNACNYMEGIKIVRQDGIITSASTRPSAVATAFIVISAMAFAAMAFYVWYLRTRLGVKKDTLL